MEIKAITKKNPKFERFNYPQEDSFAYKLDHENIAVADGITRDPIGMKERPDDEEGLIEVSKKYPRPSPAKIAADLFCKSFLGYAKKNKLNGEIIAEAFSYANNKIKQLNSKKNKNPNYLENDFWACVASAGIIKDNILYYGFIADCGVVIFNKDGNLKLRTENQGPNSRGSIDKDIRKKYDTSFKFQKGRRIIRSLYRNAMTNPLSYGALTGERTALGFIRTGSLRLEKGDYIGFYSDGMNSILDSKEFNITKCFRQLERYIEKEAYKIDGGEGTLIFINF